MDDSCAVCAESLEWVAYGGCGHKDVCSTCVARLRFICDDRRCCICKSHCHSVFITKALGDYTRLITDFSVLPSDVKEGRVGSYWYHEDTQAYFDDFDHYKMIKAMCRLSCGMCDKEEQQQQQQPSNGSKRRKFRNIGQLKGHLFHQHRLLMCSLCLEGRKVFICEQKLYTRAQLNQHINTGDSAVDGTESERGGFMGHPMCEFCRTPFYGENELYTHMSTDHYTCHICQRQHPGQYEYYKNYDDLETHFRQGHFLCEDEACLAKKFVVFQSEAEMKRHSTLEHGGRMSRSQRSAALQIPTSFRYRRSNEQNDQLGRDRTFRRDRSDVELSVAIQASLETANTDGFQDRPMSNAQVFTDRETSDVDPIIQPFESLTTDFEPPSRYLQALSHRSRNATLEESSFPPLSIAPDGNQQNPKHDSEGLSKNTMAEHLRRQKNKSMNIVNSAQAWPAALPTNRASSVINSAQAWPAPSRGPVAQETSPIRTKFSTNIGSGSTSISGQSRVAVSSGSASSSYSSSVQARPASIKEQSTCSSSSSRSWANSNRISHSSSAPNFAETGSFDSLVSDFPPVSAVQISKLPSSVQAVPNVEDAQTANKSLVERIRAGVAFDQDKYTAFKDISGQYRQGLIDARTYLSYVDNFGLTHLVLELAKLCPDAQKQRELVEIYNANYFESVPRETENFHLKDDTGFKRGKGKSIASANTQSSNNLAENVISTVQKLQSSYKPSEDEAEVLSKDGYRAGKSKSKVVSNEPQAEVSLINQSFGVRCNVTSGDGDVKSNQRKKTPKFLRTRLGDGSMAALLHPNKSDTDPEPDLVETATDRNTNPNDGFPVRGVWRQGGGHKLIAKTATRSQ